MRTTFSFHSAGEILFGCDAVLQLGGLVSRIGARRILVVTDRNLVSAGIVERVRSPLLTAGITVEIFDGGEPEPSLAMVLRCAEAARTVQPDLLIGLGGGSNMDTAKLTAILLRHKGNLADYVGDSRVPGPVAPVICVPTTAGTGSEVSAAAVYTDPERQLKVSCLSQYLRPVAAVVDPMLTLSCPRKVTADSGIDTLTHAIEGSTAVDNSAYPLPPGEISVYQGKNPLADLMAEKAIRLVGQYLPRAVADGGDLEARTAMSLAATLGGLAFSNSGVALVHAMEYPVGVATHCSHGEGNGLLLPFVMRYNLPFRMREFATVARLLGVGDNVAGLDDQTAAERAVVAVDRLRAAIGVPGKLRELGVREDQLPAFADKAFSIRRLMRVNPRFPTRDEIESLYREAW